MACHRGALIIRKKKMTRHRGALIIKKKEVARHPGKVDNQEQGFGSSFGGVAAIE
jgi:hypothetical protein